MKRASYRAGVVFVALNDNPGDKDSVETLQGYVSVVLLSELFDVPVEKVAADVFRAREREENATLS